MADQLRLGLEDAPRDRRRSALEHFHTRQQPIPPVEALAGERKASEQDAMVLAVFRARPGRRFTPSEVLDRLQAEHGARAPLLTSVRRSLTGLTLRGHLGHHKRDRRPSPRGGTESTWGLP